LCEACGGTFSRNGPETVLSGLDAEEIAGHNGRRGISFLLWGEPGCPALGGRPDFCFFRVGHRGTTPKASGHDSVANHMTACSLWPGGICLRLAGRFPKWALGRYSWLGRGKDRWTSAAMRAFATCCGVNLAARPWVGGLIFPGVFRPVAAGGSEAEHHAGEGFGGKMGLAPTR